MTTTDTPSNAEPGKAGADGPDGAVSFSLGLHRCVGNVALYRRLLERFLSTRAAAPAEIRSLWLAGRLTEAETMAHSMISTAGTLGATPLSQASRALQKALALEPAGVEACLNVFGHEHALVMSAISKHMGRYADL